MTSLGLKSLKKPESSLCIGVVHETLGAGCPQSSRNPLNTELYASKVKEEREDRRWTGVSYMEATKEGLLGQAMFWMMFREK